MSGLFGAAFLLAGCGPGENVDGGPQVSGAALGVAGAHEHGVVRAGFAVDGTRLALDLGIPGEAIFGFEHAPATETERRVVGEALSRLRKEAGRLVSFSTELRCEVVDIAVLEAPEHGGDPRDHEALHDNDWNEHEGDAEHHAEHQEDHQPGHSEVRLSVVWTCPASPEGVQAMLHIGEVLPRATLVDLTVVTSTGQAGARVGAAAPFRF